MVYPMIWVLSEYVLKTFFFDGWVNGLGGEVAISNFLCGYFVGAGGGP